MKLGITGGIGSGKTTICKVFGVLGVPVFSADEEARIIMDSDPDIIEKVKSVAGKEIYSPQGLNRMELARLIFNNTDLLNKINGVVHPVVFEHFLLWEKSSSSRYVIMESAILFESRASDLVDLVLTVVAPVEERIERIVRRNNMTRDQVIDRIKNQISDEERVALSTYVINNSDNEMIIPSVLRIHNEIISFINNGKSNG